MQTIQRYGRTIRKIFLLDISVEYSQVVISIRACYSIQKAIPGAHELIKLAKVVIPLPQKLM